jgi:hypothetical protein
MLASGISYNITGKTLVLTLFVVLCIVSVADAGLYDASLASLAQKSFLNCSEVCPCSSQPVEGMHQVMTFLGILTSAYTTCETLVRAFALGFGARMLKFVIVEKDEGLDNLRDRMWKSAVVGLAIASIVMGLGLFLPVRFRMNWLAY